MPAATDPDNENTIYLRRSRHNDDEDDNYDEEDENNDDIEVVGTGGARRQ